MLTFSPIEYKVNYHYIYYFRLLSVILLCKKFGEIFFLEFCDFPYHIFQVFKFKLTSILQ
jgi:hypothetical protein